MTSTSTAVASPTGLQTRAHLVVALAVTSGATDAVGVLALGSAFTSVMTGNMVLLGVGVADRDLRAVLLVSVAILSFMVGAAIGAKLAGQHDQTDSIWPRPVSVALQVEFVLLAVYAVAWWALGSAPSGDVLMPLLALNAAALGLQSSAIQRFGVAGLSTTYLTGTLTSVVIRLSQGKGLRTVGHSLTILAGLIVGAAVATFLLEVAPVAVPLLQLGTLGGVLVVARLSREMRRSAR
ncbi:YoaK family protein [Nocardioides jensenii]|uniref:YoaK family protein n=1 Tax=Nocardioides jensenii TaxID=1843 RepID=UPI00082C8A6C|nr:YoaK family protein [Nocardioides jensenii]